MKKNKGKHHQVKSGDEDSRWKGAKRSRSPEADGNLNHSATIATTEGEAVNSGEPTRKSQRVGKKNFVLNKGEVEFINHTNNQDVKEQKILGKLKASKLEHQMDRKCGKVKKDEYKLANRKADNEKIISDHLIDLSDLDSFHNQVEHDREGLPADHIDVSVDAAEERAFLDGVEGLDLDEQDDFELEEADTIMPVETPQGWGAHMSTQSRELNQETDFDNLRGNPAFERYLQKRMSEEGMAARKGKSKAQGHAAVSKTTPKKGNAMGKNFHGLNNCSPVVKSPSDTMIYVPALSQIPPRGLGNQFNLLTPGLTKGLGQQLPPGGLGQQLPVDHSNDFANQISDFIQGI